MSENRLTLLAVSDLHYTGLARQTAQTQHMRGELARALLKKVFLRLRHMGIKPDATLVLGDLVEDSADRNAPLDMVSLHGELLRSGIPFLVVPGNHDGDPATFNALFGSEPGLHKIGGYGFMLFNDHYNENRECIRATADLAALKKCAADHPDLPLVAVQHPPIYPPIDSHYPYRPTNAAEIVDAYQKSGVILSLSGHYHKGQKARVHERILYHTVPALCEPPFRFSLIHLVDSRVEIEDLCLGLQVPNIIDVHCHTEHAYCGTTADTAPCVALSQALGVSTLCITEHAFQLYFDKPNAMGFRWQSDPSMVKAVWETPERGRMAAYRQFAAKLRSPFVKIGLELDLLDDGNLLLAPEDLDFDWDIAIGAIHVIPGFVPGRTSQQEAERLFLRDVERLLEHDIDVLAHPFRFFTFNHLKVPSHLFATLAGLLADSGVATEVNFHAYQPETAFIRMCAEKGVKIALASDAHDLAEAGEFWPHVNALRQAGITPKMFPDTLFTFKNTIATP